MLMLQLFHLAPQGLIWSSAGLVDVISVLETVALLYPLGSLRQIAGEVAMRFLIDNTAEWICIDRI